MGEEQKVPGRLLLILVGLVLPWLGEGGWRNQVEVTELPLGKQPGARAEYVKGIVRIWIEVRRMLVVEE